MKKTLVFTNVVLVFILIGFIVYSFKPKNYGEFSDPIIDIGMTVSNASITKDFYINVIGMKEIKQFEIKSELATRLGETNGRTLGIHVLQLDEKEFSTQLKIMEVTPARTQVKKRYIDDGIGMQYITIHVGNLRPFLARIKKYDINTLGDTPIDLSRGRKIVVVQDPDGNFIELIGQVD